MGFLKKHGKPRQYEISRSVIYYELRVWVPVAQFWRHVALATNLDKIRKAAALDAKVRGYGDNYEITEVL